MADLETRFARQLLVHKPQRPLLFDADSELQTRIETISGAQVQRIDPQQYFRQLPEDVEGGTAGDLFAVLPSLADADLVYIADITAMVEAMAPLVALSAINLLGTFRDRVRGTVYVAFPPAEVDQSAMAGDGAALCKADFFALGFVDASRELYPISGVEASSGSCSRGLFRYSLRDYKAMPGWLNSKYWANPERWNAAD